VVSPVPQFLVTPTKSESRLVLRLKFSVIDEQDPANNWLVVRNNPLPAIELGFKVPGLGVEVNGKA
jgi:hypothetical protein